MVKIRVGKDEGKYTESELLEIMRALRAPGGCPWDIEQTHKSIRNDLLEEAFEVADAIDTSDSEALCEELGDLLLQVVFHSVISEEEKLFDYSDVVDGIARKLILRHPHVFGEAKAENSAEVLDLWDDIKKQEKHQATATDTLKSVPRAFPALMRAAKVQKRAKKAGYEFSDPVKSGELTRLCETLSKLYETDKQAAADTYGKLLFELSRLGKELGVDPEERLGIETDRFIESFEKEEKGN
ncbi:MAG: nucleoside triphosphate pyrophosphohydrolase [Clostridia bacterium]|nr:nucleoside triphosphate pyrophosphohydrolase [Clostridia bacterium]